MPARIAWIFSLLGTALLYLVGSAQQPVPQPLPVGPAQGPQVPPGLEVLARGPVHEAFATPTTEPRPTPWIPRKPPIPLDEMPPEERPEGEVAWIGGYWAWDDDRQDFLWVSGCWRTPPADKQWVPGYWRDQAEQWQWVPGFWANAAQGKIQDVTYYPEPPAPPQVAPPGDPPAVDMFYVPGSWVWGTDRYAWRAGYWARVRPGYVYVPSHYRWTPYGYVHVAGYWDFAIPRRGVLYAPVTIQVAAIRPGFVYTPVYAVTDTLVLDALFVRPAYGHYYFGDYYGPRYTAMGFEACVVYSRRHYDPIIVYQRYEYRDRPNWFNLQINLTLDRHAGRASLPPRTLVQQNTIIQQNITNVTINNNTTNISKTQVLAPTKNVVAARGGKAVNVDSSTRMQAKQSADLNQKAALQERVRTESAAASLPNQGKPRVASFNVPTPGGVGNMPPRFNPGPMGSSPTIPKGPAGFPGNQPAVGKPNPPQNPGPGTNPGLNPPLNTKLNQGPITPKGPPNGPNPTLPGGNPPKKGPGTFPAVNPPGVNPPQNDKFKGFNPPKTPNNTPKNFPPRDPGKFKKGPEPGKPGMKR